MKLALKTYLRYSVNAIFGGARELSSPLLGNHNQGKKTEIKA